MIKIISIKIIDIEQIAYGVDIYIYIISLEKNGLATKLLLHFVRCPVV